MPSYALKPEAVELVTQTLKTLWKTLNSEQKQERFGIHPTVSKLTFDTKVAMLGVAKNTAIRIFRGESVSVSTLEYIFGRLDIEPEFTPQRYGVISEPQMGRLPRSAFVCLGREAEIEAIKMLLESAEMVTLIGMGGIGKTRLAKQAAYEIQDNFADGVFWVELAGISQPDDILLRVAAALGVQEQSRSPLLLSLTEFLQTKQLLLLLDNCEHLLEACAVLANQLLAASSALKIMATSRKRLGIAFERPLRVTPLPIPDPKHLPPDADRESLCHQFASVRLFDERARILRPDYLKYHGIETLASICSLLEGIPLAIELAAGRIGSASLAELEQELEDRFRLLIGRDHAAYSHQQTLLATMEWSYGLLTPSEQMLLNRLALFADGWTREAAEAICSDDAIKPDDVMNLLFALEAASLILFQEGAGKTRYTMLETVRQYGKSRLTQCGEADALAERHRDFFLRLAEQTAPLLSGEQHKAGLLCLESDHENLKAAIEWTLARNDAQAALRFCNALNRFWGTRSYLTEGRDFTERMLALAGKHQETPEYARAFSGAGSLAFYQSDLVRSIACYQASLQLYEQLGDRNGMARARNGIAYALSYQGDLDSAQAHYEESLSHFEAVSDQNGIAYCLTLLGSIDEAHGDHASAHAKFERNLCFYRKLGDPQRIANALKNVGFSTMSLGDLEAARPLFEESLRLYRESENKSGMASSHNGLGLLAYSLANYAAACSHYQQSLLLSREVGNRNLAASALLSLGHIARHEGETAEAQGHYEESRALAKAVGSPSIAGLAEEALQQVREEQRMSQLGI